MAAAGPAVTPETPIAIKLMVGGLHRRFKLPLGELTATELPSKLRRLLSMRDEHDLVLERYSDSAGSYITLDPEVPAVYKQLHRAAKAKLKLRLKASIVNKAVTPEADTTTPSESPDKMNQWVAQDAQHKLNDWIGQVRRYDEDLRCKLAEPEVENKPKSEVAPTVVPLPPCGPIPQVGSKFGRYEKAQVQSDDEDKAKVPDCLQTIPVTSTASPPPVPAKVEIKQEAPASPELPRDTAETRSKTFFADVANATGVRPAAHRLPLHRAGGTVLNLPGLSYSVYCNFCDAPIPNAHYHCSICDDGDFDLCQGCVDQGVLCCGVGHWLIKRFVQNGRVINSTTETIAPRKVEAKAGIETARVETAKAGVDQPRGEACTEDMAKNIKQEVIELEPPQKATGPSYLTCNSCIGVFAKARFVTCMACEDFDFCLDCHLAQKHGHHPAHRFKPAVEGTFLTPLELALCSPGAGAGHCAVCDGCEQSIYGVRHKCLNCPDWDYCATCILGAHLSHPGHRFAPIYEPIPVSYGRAQAHHGIFCDGPLCFTKGKQSAIIGDRYKCAVCHDTDFCANCEANPINRHNKTHPLIKFRTPVRNVSVSTVGSKDNGEPMATMGDMFCRRTRSTATETARPAVSTNAATQVQVVADLKPTSVDIPGKRFGGCVRGQTTSSGGLDAHFVSDLVADGSQLPPNHVFTQTWTLRNAGPASWPKGSSIKFVGGDNMRNVDPAHPSSVSDLEKSLESNVLMEEVKPAAEHSFSVTLRTPSREGKCISYWRMTSPAGDKFGHKLWCDVDVSKAAVLKGAETESSKVIFPTLEKESPVPSQHEAAQTGKTVQVADEDDADLVDELESLKIDSNDESDGEGFNTDEEYDILDASDEEFLSTVSKAGK